MTTSTKRVCLDCGGDLGDDSQARCCTRCLLEACFEEGGVHGAPEGGEPTANDLAVPGEVFGDYLLEEEIARGGMGIVFKARQRSLDRVVAVKMMLPGWLNRAESVRRFRMEAEAASRLRHPQIVAIHEVGECEGQPFYSMDYIEGLDLVRRLKKGPVAPELSARWVQRMAEAIHHAHQHGILHRDLKPANVIIDAQDEPHVTDFGLAKLLDDARDLTATGRVMGTPSFMPPEQADPSRGEVTVASDVYGLGAVLYFLLAGAPPFEGETMEHTLKLLMTADPVPPSRRRPGTPRDLEIICLKCLRKEPPRRYGSAAELARDLAAWANCEPISARPVPVAERFWFWARRNPMLAGVSSALVVAIGTAIVMQQLLLNENQRARAVSEGLIQFMLQDLTEQLRPLGRLRLLDNVNRTVQQYYEGLPMKNNLPDPRAGKAQFYRNDASVLRELGRLQEAETSARSAIALLESEVKKSPDQPQWAVALAEAYAELRNILALSNPAAALHAGQEAVNHCQRACALLASDEAAQLKLANAHLEYGSVLRDLGKTADAAHQIRHATDLLQRLSPVGSNAAPRQLQLALGCYYQGLICLDQKDKAGARQRFAEYLNRTEQLAQEQSDPGDAQAQYSLAVAHSYLGPALLSNGEYRDALSHFREYLRLAEHLERIDPGNVNFRRELGRSLTWLAEASEKTGESTEDIDALLRRALTVFQKLAREFPDGDIWQGYAFDAVKRLAVWQQRQDPTQARTLLADEAKYRWDQLLRPGNQRKDYRRFLEALDWAEDDSMAAYPGSPDRPTRLRPWLDKINEQALKPDPQGHWRWLKASLHTRLAHALALMNDFGGARRELEAALPLWLQAASAQTDDPETLACVARAYCGIGIATVRSGNASQAPGAVRPFLDWLKTRRASTAGRREILDRALALQNELSNAQAKGAREVAAVLEELGVAIDDLQSQLQPESAAAP